jgi:hypothetical protein
LPEPSLIDSVKSSAVRSRRGEEVAADQSVEADLTARDLQLLRPAERVFDGGPDFVAHAVLDVLDRLRTCGGVGGVDEAGDVVFDGGGQSAGEGLASCPDGLAGAVMPNPHEDDEQQLAEAGEVLEAMGQGPERVGDVGGVAGMHADPEDELRLTEEEGAGANPHVVEPDDHRPDIGTLREVQRALKGVEDDPLADALQVLKHDGCVSCHAIPSLARVQL